MKYQYFINLDERGEFYADVRDESENTVLDINGYDIFTDGYMSDGYDLCGLHSYMVDMVDMGVISESDSVIRAN